MEMNLSEALHAGNGVAHTWLKRRRRGHWLVVVKHARGVIDLKIGSAQWSDLDLENAILVMRWWRVPLAAWQPGLPESSQPQP